MGLFFPEEQGWTGQNLLAILAVVVLFFSISHHMGWFFPERRGPRWNQGWTGQTQLAILAIVFLFLFISNYMQRMHQTMINFQPLFYLIPVLLIFIVRSMSVNGRFGFSIPQPEHDSFHRAGSSPWGVAAVLVLVLVMISYQSSLPSQWFRPLWKSD
ncbi:uncharacterized protein LOC131243481 [Magnolia sinica]|uniref:uncharacterized protein LOC131243481 n=1 Tax=Magnolia sinica TaxID=86752 RepID=UPI00265AC5A0|nr:uncharacterized protein LOC131243481 [Magnolia sinica]